MSEESGVTIMEVQGSEVAYLQDKAIIDSMVATAHAFPRNLKRCIEDAIAIVTMDAEIAASCTYSVPRAGKAITGPSVHLARIILQCYGNMRAETKVIDTEAKHVTSQGIAFDLQKNTAIKVEVKKSILTKSGRMSEDMIIVTGNASNAIALRNAIFSVIPKAITDKIYKEAMKTITGDISDATKLLKKRKRVVEALINSYNVTEAEVLGSIGKVSLDHIGQEEIIVLIGIGTAIKDGDTTVDLAFRGKKSESKTKEEIEKEREEELNAQLNKETK